MLQFRCLASNKIPIELWDITGRNKNSNYLKLDLCIFAQNYHDLEKNSIAMQPNLKLKKFFKNFVKKSKQKVLMLEQKY